VCHLPDRPKSETQGLCRVLEPEYRLPPKRRVPSRPQHNPCFRTSACITACPPPAEKNGLRLPPLASSRRAAGPCFFRRRLLYRFVHVGAGRPAGRAAAPRRIDLGSPPAWPNRPPGLTGRLASPAAWPHRPPGLTGRLASPAAWPHRPPGLTARLASPASHDTRRPCAALVPTLPGTSTWGILPMSLSSPCHDPWLLHWTGCRP